MAPHNLPLAVVGAALLWVGWFGFNGGSALQAGSLAVSAFVATNSATAAAVLSWMYSDWMTKGKPTVLGAASGAVAGLVAITPASGYVGPLSAIAIGAVAGIVCSMACNLKARLGYDDTLDVVGIHGVGGAAGALLSGFFASNGLFFGNSAQLGIQAIAVVVTGVYSFLGALILFKVVDVVLGLRVPEEDEFAGLDLSQHGEKAYTP
jgi:Amt family ammonium transporter